jgi:transcription initiation factor TFIIH subunit 4
MISAQIKLNFLNI